MPAIPVTPMTMKTDWYTTWPEQDMGRNLANVQTLRDIGDIPPYKWNGKNQTIYKQDGMRFSTILTRTEAFSHKELDALVAYIITGNQESAQPEV